MDPAGQTSTSQGKASPRAHCGAQLLLGTTHPHPLRYPHSSKSHSRKGANHFTASHTFPVLQSALPRGWKRQETTSSAPSLALKPGRPPHPWERSAYQEHHPRWPERCRVRSARPGSAGGGVAVCLQPLQTAPPKAGTRGLPQSQRAKRFNAAVAWIHHLTAVPRGTPAVHFSASCTALPCYRQRISGPGQ